MHHHIIVIATCMAPNLASYNIQVLSHEAVATLHIKDLGIGPVYIIFSS